MKNTIKTHHALKTVMTLLTSKETSDKALQTELTVLTPVAQATQASSTNVTTQQYHTSTTSSVSFAYPATQIRLNSILKANKRV